MLARRPLALILVILATFSFVLSSCAKGDNISLLDKSPANDILNQINNGGNNTNGSTDQPDPPKTGDVIGVQDPDPDPGDDPGDEPPPPPGGLPDDGGSDDIPDRPVNPPDDFPVTPPADFEWPDYYDVLDDGSIAIYYPDGDFEVPPVGRISGGTANLTYPDGRTAAYPVASADIPAYVELQEGEDCVTVHYPHGEIDLYSKAYLYPNTGCPCGCAEGACGCDTVCLNPDHLHTYKPVNPEFYYTTLNIAVAKPDGAQLKAAVTQGIGALDGRGKDITDQITIVSVDGIPADGSFDWDASAARFGLHTVALSVTNVYGLKDELVRTVTVADIPKLSLAPDHPSLRLNEAGNIVVYTGEAFGKDNITAALAVSDGYDSTLTAANAYVSFGGYNNSAAGVYDIVIRITNAQNFSAELNAKIEVVQRENPFALAQDRPTHFAMLKTVGANIRLKALEGVTAFDPVYGDITDKIVIDAVQVGENEVQYGGFNWNTLTDRTGLVRVTLKLNSDFSDLTAFSFTREITLIDAPELTVEQGTYTWEQNPSGAEGFSIYVGEDFDILSAVTVQDASDPLINAASAFVAGDGGFNINSAGIYEITVAAVNAHGIRSEITVSVWIKQPPDALLTLNGSPNFALLSGTVNGAALQRRLLEGLSATDGFGQDITDSIRIVSVNGQPFDTVDFNALAASTGVITVVAGLTDPSDNTKFFSVTRVVTLAVRPVLSFDGAVFGSAFKGENRLEIQKDQAFDYMRGISVTDALQTDLAQSAVKATVRLTPDGDPVDFDAAVPGTYYITYTALNRYGFAAIPVTVVVEVLAPVPVFTGPASVTVAKTDGEGFKDAVLDGIAADDGEGGNITSAIGIYAVNGTVVDGGFDWDSAGMTLGKVTVTLRVENSYGKVEYFTRELTVADIPVITFDYTGFVLEENRVRVFTGESFDYMSALSVTDASDDALTVADIAVTGTVNTAVTGSSSKMFRAHRRSTTWSATPTAFRSFWPGATG